MAFPAPARTLTAVVSGRAIAFDAIGRPALLTFCAPGSQQLVDDVIRGVRRRVPLASDLLSANVVDLSSVPRVLRKVPELLMSQRYHDGAKLLSAGRDPADYLVVLPDWDGTVSRAFGLDASGGSLGLAVLDAAGIVLGTALTAEPAAALDALLACLDVA